MCNKPLRSQNSSLLCSYHAPGELNRTKKRKKCSICALPCSGKLLIEIKKDRMYSFCTRHFNKLNLIKDLIELRKEMGRLKLLSLTN